MAKYVQYHWKGSDIFSKISSQYNFDTNFTYDTYTYNDYNNNNHNHKYRYKYKY